MEVEEEFVDDVKLPNSLQSNKLINIKKRKNNTSIYTTSAFID